MCLHHRVKLPTTEPESNPAPELKPEPFPLPAPGVVGTAALTIGLTLLPLSMGQEGRYEPNPFFSHKPESKPDENDNITLYRGVDPSNPYFQQAKDGWAIPLGWHGDGHTDPASHNANNTNSIYTSWTRTPMVAVRFAGEYGVVLVQTFKLGRLVPSPDVFNEQEILVPGIVRAAAVFPAWTFRKI